MSSREQPSRLNFTNTRGRGGRLRPDLGNRFYFRGKGGASTTRPALNSPPEPELKKGLDTTRSLGVITAPARPAAPDHFPIENVKYVASYNWIDAEKPTIVVPGAMLSLRYVFVLISVINSLQVRQPYGLSVRSHSRCSLMVTSFMSTGMMIARSCPNIRCCHFWPLRTRYIARRRPHLSTGQRWTSLRTAIACASSCAGLTRLQAEKCAISGLTFSLSETRLSCYAAGKPPQVRSTRTIRLGMPLRPR
jgi:hypothetical protein